MFFTDIGCVCGVSPKGLVHNLLMFFNLRSSKIEDSETYFSDLLTAHNDHPCYVKHVLGRIYVFFTLFGCSLLKEDSLRGGLAQGNRI